jgi:tetratricopeptide (TPR) repeat protein
MIMAMKLKNAIIYTVLACLMASCTITGRISRQQTSAVIEHSDHRKKEYVEEKEPEKSDRGYVEYTRVDSTKFLILPTSEDGLPIQHLQEVVVTGTRLSRSIPERNGKVNLDFVVTLPKELMGNCRGVEVVPVLHKETEDIPLQDLTIRGALFDKVQERNYWQYDRYLDVYTPDETGRQWAYERFIYYPYPEGTRLDSIVSNKENISYYYTQEVPTAEAEGNQLLITLQGRVAALDHSEYRFPLSDTLKYNISSMLHFVDTTTRYVTRVIEKYAVVNDRNYLNFPVNKSEIVDTLGDNQTQLARIEGLMDEILNQKEFYVDSIILTASASPEGSVRKNDQLAKERAQSLREHLVRRFPQSRMDTLITVRWIGEDWTELAKLIEKAPYSQILWREKILPLIANGGDMDAVEQTIKKEHPSDYRYMLEELYPRLRAVSFKYDLRRVGMVKDTIHTTVPDTLYARGVKLLNGRKYNDALKVLGGFRDRNAAICMLSLGMDEQAYSVLNALPEHSTHSYLLAIVCARLGREDEALSHFDRAVELNEHIRWRGNLDPEISSLIKQRENETTTD